MNSTLPKHDNVVFLSNDAGEEDDNIVDLFCGCGGSGTGIMDATKRLGRRPRGTFVNHNRKALNIHEANHPEHRHIKEDLFLLRPETVFPPGTNTSLLWGSPSCVQFSVSRGNRPINEQQRSHADTVKQWVAHLNPDCVIIENVKEFRQWGPLRQKKDKVTGELSWAREMPKKKKKSEMCVVPFPKLPAEHIRRAKESVAQWEIRMHEAGYLRHLEPDPELKGTYFDAWRDGIHDTNDGYTSEYKIICSADHGDPTIRTRLFVMFVRNGSGKKICWPTPRYTKPDKQGNVPPGMMPWKTAADHVIDWSLTGQSIFVRPKPLAKATARRLAIGLVRIGMRGYLLPKDSFGDDRVRDPHKSPLGTVTTEHRGEGLAAPVAYSLRKQGLNPNMDAPIDPAVSPLPTVIGDGRQYLAQTVPYVLPKDQGFQNDRVVSVDYPATTVQTTAADSLASPFLVQLNGQSTARTLDSPLPSQAGCEKLHTAEPLIAHLRGKNTASSTKQPLRAVTASGTHELLADALMMVVDNAGKNGSAHRMHAMDEPVRVIGTKANQSTVRFSLHELHEAIRTTVPDDVDVERVEQFLSPLIDELKKVGKADVKPWIYVYYGSGSVGSPITAPMPCLRTKANVAIAYPMIEMDGDYIVIDLLYRMLTTLELQRAQGFGDDFVWPVGITKTDQVRAIGNSVSRGLAEALTLAYYSQDSDISKFF